MSVSLEHVKSREYLQALKNTPNSQPCLMNTFLDETLLGSVKDGALKFPEGYSDNEHSENDSVDEESDVVKSTRLQTWVIKHNQAKMQVKPCQDVERKKFEILRLMKTEDMRMMDLKLSLYVSAANSDVRLKPMPYEIVDESPEGMLALAWLNSRIPPLEIFKQYLRTERSENVDHDVVNIIHWLIVQLRQPKFINLPTENFDSVFERVEYAINLQNPTFMVKIMVNNLSSNHLQWQAAKGTQATKFAFFATKPEHIHSLVHLGLYPFQKVSGPFGTGVYLTTDLWTCLESSPPTWVWGKSALGTQLQIAVVVEFIASHSKIVRFRDGQLYPYGKPCHYYVPYNNLMQARYLLIYVKNQHQSDSKALEIIKKRRLRQEILQMGLLFGGYIALCCVAWRHLSGSNSSSLLKSILLEKLRGNKLMAPLALFIQPIKEIL